MQLIKHLLILFFLSLFLHCENTSENKDEDLYVKFENSTTSSFTITSIEIMLMGVSGEETPSPTGKWSGNLLKDGATIEPGHHTFLDLVIPNRHYAQYRLAVLDENDDEIYLHQQNGYPQNSMQGTVTHWGSDERSVSVTVQRNQSTQRIQVMGYSDFAGID